LTLTNDFCAVDFKKGILNFEIKRMRFLA
jgi:hypothetical protein